MIGRFTVAAPPDAEDARECRNTADGQVLRCNTRIRRCLPSRRPSATTIAARKGAKLAIADLDAPQSAQRTEAMAIALYGRTSKNAKDARTRQLASAALPQLREHARHVQSAQADAMR